MADETDAPRDAADTNTAKAPGAFGQPEAAGASGGINQGTETTLTPEQEALRRRRMSAGDLVDDNAASHQGGMGAQSGQADYGSAGNLAGDGLIKP